MSHQHLAETLISDLQGTCKSLDDVLEDLGYDIGTVPFEVLQILDNNILRCECCEWWVEISECNEEGVCSDCAPEEY